MKRNKINKSNLLFLKANKILKRHYAEILHGRDLTKEEIIAEAKDALRKWEDCAFLVNMQSATELKKEDWQKIVDLGE